MQSYYSGAGDFDISSLDVTFGQMQYSEATGEWEWEETTGYINEAYTFTMHEINVSFCGDMQAGMDMADALRQGARLSDFIIVSPDRPFGGIVF